jgi:hypothetical protein
MFKTLVVAKSIPKYGPAVFAVKRACRTPLIKDLFTQKEIVNVFLFPLMLGVRVSLGASAELNRRLRSIW